MTTAAWKHIGAGIVAASAAAAYSPRARRWYQGYGATAEEAARALPGDDLLPDASVVSTRAVTIAAAPSSVWPWLVDGHTITAGDVLPVGPGMRVEICEPEHTLALRSLDGGRVWIFNLSLYWLGTRLISRHRTAGGRLRRPGLIADRRKLLGVKRDAEWSAPGAGVSP